MAIAQAPLAAAARARALHGVRGRAVRVGGDDVAAHHDARSRRDHFACPRPCALGEVPRRLVQLELQHLFRELAAVVVRRGGR